MAKLSTLNVPVREGGQTTMQNLELASLTSLVLPVKQGDTITNVEFELPGGTPETEQKDITATTSVQVITPTAGKYIDEVTVRPQVQDDVYVYPVNSTGATVDFGATNNYRKVNAANVYTKGQADGKTVHTATYTFPANDTGGTKDLTADHTYRYVNAQNVYERGKADGGTFNIVVGVSTGSLKGYSCVCKNSSGTVVATKTLDATTGKAMFGLTTAGTYTFSVTY